jgi:hypothetical protein
MHDGDEPEEPTKARFLGLKIVLPLVPIYVVFANLDKPELGLTVMIVLGTAIVAVLFQWRYRVCRWFWPCVVLTLGVQVPIVLLIHWPKTSVPTIAYTMPFGLAEYLLMTLSIKAAARVFGTHGVDENDA